MQVELFIVRVTILGRLSSLEKLLQKQISQWGYIYKCIYITYTKYIKLIIEYNSLSSVFCI